MILKLSLNTRMIWIIFMKILMTKIQIKKQKTLMILFLICLVTKSVTIVIELFTRTTIYYFQQFKITKSFGDSNFRGNIIVE